MHANAQLLDGLIPFGPFGLAPASSPGGTNDLSRLLAPASIAVLGASDRPGNLGKVVVDNLLKFGFPGMVYPIHPANSEVSGLVCYPSVASLPEIPDMVIFAVAAHGLVDAVRQCVEAGVTCGIALAGGFSEGGADGRERQHQLEQLCHESHFVLCGPNCIGVINTALPMAATFTSALINTDRLLKGNISVVSQSGGIAVFTQSLAAVAGYGVRYVVSSGNEAVTTTADYVAAFSRDPGTSVICVYVEGLKNASRFVEALAAARTAGKIVILLKAGATPQSVIAAMAHTGALAGEDRVWDAVLREYAVVRVYSLEEMLDTALYLSGLSLEKVPRGPGVALVGFGGGGGVLGADQCAAVGLKVSVLDADRLARLRPLVPPIASISNPFDLTPDCYNKPEWLARFPAALDDIAQDPDVDILLIQLGATGHKADELIDAILQLVSGTDKAVAVAWTLAPPHAVSRLQQAGIHVFAEQSRAISTLGRLAAVRYTRQPHPDVRGLQIADKFDWTRWVSNAAPGTVVSEHDCHAMLKVAGLPVAAGRFFTNLANPAEAVKACAEVGYPLALKGISAMVTHRAAAGLVILDIDSDEAVRLKVQEFCLTAEKLSVRLDGIYAQKMVHGGVELIVGASRDPVFGIVISCGAGGVLTELMDDVEIERAPVSRTTARGMLQRLRIVRHSLARTHGLNVEPVIDFIVQFSSMAASAPWSEFVLEVNPVKWTQQGVVAVDGLLIVGQP